MSWRRTWSSNTNKLQIQYHPTRSTYHKAALVEKKINSIAGMAVLEHLEAFQNKFTARPDHAQTTRGISRFRPSSPGLIPAPAGGQNSTTTKIFTCPSARGRRDGTGGRGGGQRRSPCRPRKHCHQRPSHTQYLSLYVCQLDVSPYVETLSNLCSKLIQPHHVTSP